MGLSGMKQRRAEDVERTMESLKQSMHDSSYRKAATAALHDNPVDETSSAIRGSLRRDVDGKPSKEYLGINVLEAAHRRIEWVFEEFDYVYLSFSGGKDSTVMLHMVGEYARSAGKRFGILFIDLEAQYKATICHIENMVDMYSDVSDLYWIAAPLALRNAVSQFQPKWKCWDPEEKDRWVREYPSRAYDTSGLDFIKDGMEFEELVPAFGRWVHEGRVACLVGIRADESLNRYRTVRNGRKRTHKGRMFTTLVTGDVYNVYPIYDWKTSDVWTYHAKTGHPYNGIYDLMHRAGVSIHSQRICQPYGDDQRRGLWLYQILEPETWGKVVARVNGANSGALYSKESGNVTGAIKVTLPDGHTWQSFAMMLLDSMPEKAAEHYRNKIWVFINWWKERGFPDGQIPDVAEQARESAKEVPSWRRICKTLLRNDYYCKGLSFTQTKSDAYDKYKKLMKKRRELWDLSW
jgi:predicted phosphoadenosine phosphosulfate sulfurtransferase